MNRFSHDKPVVALVSRAKMLALLVAGAALAAGCSSTPQVDGPLIISLDRNDAQDAGIGGVVAIEDDGCVTVDGFVVAWPPGTSWDEESQLIVLPDGSRIGDGDSVAGSGGANEGDALRFSLGEEALAEAERCTSSRVNEEPGVLVFNSQSDSVSAAAAANTQSTTSVPVQSTRPVTFSEFEQERGGSSLSLALDACFPTLDNVDVDEKDDVVTIAIIESFTPPTTNALGEGDVVNDCQSFANVELDQPLADRKVVDAATGEMAEDITE